MKILGTGLTGLVGSRIVELLNNTYEFENLSTSTGVDILDKESVIERIKNSNAEIVIHLAAKANVDGCEKDHEKDIKILGYKDINEQEREWKKEKTAWAVNVLGTRNIVDSCFKNKKKLIYISTDFVFNGNNCPVAGYDETDITDPINWYGKTKSEGEKIIQNSGLNWIIVRIAYPYRANFIKNDFVKSLINAFQERNKLNTVTDHIMCPTFIDDVARALDLLIQKEEKGIFHAVGSQKISPYEAALLIAKNFGFDPSLLNKVTRDDYFKDRAKRPFQLFLKNDKIEKLGLRMKTFEEGLEEIKRQLDKVKS